MRDFYSQLSDMDLLIRAWHLAHDEVRGDDLILDAMKHSDFGFYRVEYLESISRSLRNGSYHPKPLRYIDLPKRNYTVRPLSVTSLEDRIVLYAIAILIAPKLDDKLPEFVRSWRLKRKGKDEKKNKESELFIKRLPYKYPFLKSTTISRHLGIFKPWYEAWPVINQEMVKLYNKGYTHMMKTDVSSYFENIELVLLRETLTEHLGERQQRIVNFLMQILSYWAWPAINLVDAPRGIPQGNGVSSFLGNFYLISLDQMLKEFSEMEDIKPLRYMDDITVFARNRYVLRECLLKINTTLRELRLNVNGAKTKFYDRTEIKKEFPNKEIERIDRILKSIRKMKSDDKNRKIHYAEILKGMRKKIPTTISSKKESAYYRRVVTAHSMLQDPGMIKRVLEQIRHDSDFKILISARNYFRVLTDNIKTISEGVIDLLENENTYLFDFQKAWLFTILRYTRIDSDRAFEISKPVIDNREIDQYIREQSAILCGTRILDKKQQNYILRKFKKEFSHASKRAWIHGISQLDREKLEPIATKLLIDTEPEIQRIGQMVNELINYKDVLRDRFGLLRFKYESILVDRIWEIDMLSKNQHREVREALLNYLQKHSANVKLPFLRERLLKIQRELES